MNTYNVKIGRDGSTHRVVGRTAIEAAKTLTLNVGNHVVYVAQPMGWALAGTITKR